MPEEKQKVGRYELMDELGSGGFATVYRAYDPLLDCEVALKVLHGHHAQNDVIRRRFLQEGRSLRRVRHPHVVDVDDAGEAGGAPYLVMQLIQGRPLAQILRESGPMPLERVVTITEQVAAALAAVHSHNLVHRDVNPNNIMIEADTGRAMLLDLGIARATDAPTLGLGGLVGTIPFMAPEQIDPSGQVSPQTDVYQLGATVFALLTTQPPFTGEMTQILGAIIQHQPPDLATLRPGLPLAVAEAVAAALAKDPAQRPPGTAAFAARLRVAAGPAQAATVDESAGPVAGTAAALGATVADEAPLPPVAERATVADEIPRPIPPAPPPASAPDDTAAAPPPASPVAGAPNSPLDNPLGGTPAAAATPVAAAAALSGGAPPAAAGRSGSGSSKAIFIGAALLALLIVGAGGVFAARQFAGSLAGPSPTAVAAPTAATEQAPATGGTATPTGPDPQVKAANPPGPIGPGGQPKAPPSALADEAFGPLPGSVSAVAVLGDGQTVERSAGQQLPAASLIKKWIAGAAFEEVAAGRLNLSEEYTLREADQAPGTGILNQSNYIGRKLTYAELIDFMLVYSDNTAANVVLNRIGGVDVVNRYAQGNGYPQTLMQRPLGRVNPGQDNFTSAADTARFISNLVQKQVVNETASNSILESLAKRRTVEDRRQDFFGVFLPRQTDYRHLSGINPAIRNEAGFFAAGPGGNVVVAVLLANLTDERAGEDAIGRAVDRIYRATR